MPGSASDAMYAVGVIEIVAGIAVLVKPRYGAYLVAAWLAGIVVNLLTYSGYYDVALRDFATIQPRARVETVQERPESCNIPTVDVFQQNRSENGLARLVVSNHCGPPSISHHLAVLDRFKNTCVNTARYGRNLSSVIGRSRTRFPVAW